MTRWGRATVAVALVALATAPAAATPAPGPGRVDLGGTPVPGVSADAQNPVELTAGLWSDTLTGSGEVEANTHLFRYQRTMAGSTVLIGVVGVSPESDTTDMVEVVVDEAAGEECASDNASSTYPSHGAAFGTSVSVGSQDLNDPCLRSDHLDLAVSRGTADLDSDLPIGIRIVEEAPVVDLASLPDADGVRTVPVPTPGDARPATGAASFDDAPTLEPGTWSDTVREGEERLYRVRLGWGESLTTRVDVPRVPEAEQEDFVFAFPTVESATFDPLRGPVESSVEGYVASGKHDAEGATLFDGTPSVRFLNRYDGAPAAVPGDHWVSVTASPAPESRAAVDVPIELTVVVDGPGEGEPDGAPDFPQTVQGPGGGAGPEGYDERTPYLVGEGQFAADVTGTPQVADAAGAAADDVRRTAGLAVGALSLLALAAGAALLLRRGRLSRAAAR